MMNTMKRQMKIYRIFLAAAVAVLGMGLVSCKKDKSTDESKEYLTGSMNFSIPTYVMPGQQFHLVPTGVTKTDGGTPGIYWTDSYFSVRDTTRRENGAGDGAFDFTVPSDVTSMTLTCAAFADGYYNMSKVVSLVIVKGAESITGLDLPDDVAILVAQHLGGETQTFRLAIFVVIQADVGLAHLVAEADSTKQQVLVAAQLMVFRHIGEPQRHIAHAVAAFYQDRIMCVLEEDGLALELLQAAFVTGENETGVRLCGDEFRR